MSEIIKKLEEIKQQIIFEFKSLKEALVPHLEHTRVEEEVVKKKPKKIPKSTKKIEAGTHRISKTPCNKCGGLISWDNYNKEDPTPPLHVDKDGHVKGNGQCPEWEEQ